MKTHAFFNTITFLILFAVVLYAIATSFSTMHRYIGRLDRMSTPAPKPIAKLMTVAEL